MSIRSRMPTMVKVIRSIQFCSLHVSYSGVEYRGVRLIWAKAGHVRVLSEGNIIIDWCGLGSQC